MRYTHLLCPVDFSEHSMTVLRHALAVAVDPSARVVVFHAVEPLLLQAATIAGHEVSVRADLLADLGRLIDEAAPAARRPAIESRVVQGAPHAAILEAAGHEDCDLIVMGTHGAGGLAKAWLGSTLEHVLRATPVPVLAIPPRGPGLVLDAPGAAITTVVAAVDFEEPSIVAARVAAGTARRYGADLTLLHVVPDAPRWTRWQDMLDRERAKRCDRAARELEWLAEELRAAGTNTTATVVAGSPAERIAGFCAGQPGTLVVLGLRGEASRGSARPGAMAYRVLCAGTQPVLVVPAGERAVRAYTVGS